MVKTESGKHEYLNHLIEVGSCTQDKNLSGFNYCIDGWAKALTTLHVDINFSADLLLLQTSKRSIYRAAQDGSAGSVITARRTLGMRDIYFVD